MKIEQGTLENTKKESDCFACKLYKQHHSEFQNEWVLVLPNHFPYIGEDDSHTIILPSRHIHLLSELDQRERDAFYYYWQQVALIYDRVFGSSVSLGRNNAGGGSVWHLHSHITRDDKYIDNFSRGEYKGLNKELKEAIKKLQ